MESAKSPEFDPKRPVASAAAVLRGIFLGPRAFYANFDAGGPLREPVMFVLFIGAVSAALRLLLVLAFSAGGLGASGIVVVIAEALVYAALSPLLVAAFSGAYLLAVRAIVGPEGSFRGVYRILAYAWGATILLPFPVLDSLSFTYATLVLMGLGIGLVYRTSFITALVTALTGYVPSAVLFIYLTILAVGLTTPG